MGITSALVVVPAFSASATHPTVTGTAVCNTSTGLSDITWRVAGDSGYPNETATIKTQSTATTPTLVGTSVKADGYVEGVQSGVSKGTFTLTVKVQWTNHRDGDLVSQTGTVKVSANCNTPPSEDDTDSKITICHRTNSATNPYVEITVDDDAVDGIAGDSGNEADHYGEHKGPLAYSAAYAQQLKDDKIEWGDIIPVVLGVHNGQNLDNGGAAILANHCNFVSNPEPLVAAASVTTTTATCDVAETASASGVANATLTSSTGTTGPGTYSFVFTADKNALFPAGPGVSSDRLTKTITGTLAGADDDPTCHPVIDVDAFIEVSKCHYNLDEDYSYKYVILTFDNEGSNVPQTFTVSAPYSDLSRTVPAGERYEFAEREVLADGATFVVTVGSKVFNLEIKTFDGCKPAEEASPTVTILTSCGVADIELRNDLGDAIERETAEADVYFDGVFQETISADGGEVTNVHYTFPEDSGDVEVTVKDHADDAVLATATVKTDCLPPDSLKGQDVTYKAVCGPFAGIFTLITTTTPWTQGWVAVEGGGWELADKVLGTSSDASTVVSSDRLNELKVDVPQGCTEKLAFTGSSEFDAFLYNNAWYIITGVLLALALGVIMIVSSVRRNRKFDAEGDLL